MMEPRGLYPAEKMAIERLNDIVDWFAKYYSFVDVKSAWFKQFSFHILLAQNVIRSMPIKDEEERLSVQKKLDDCVDSSANGDGRSDTDLNVMIAELKGWKGLFIGYGRVGDSDVVARWMGVNPETGQNEIVPDYVTMYGRQWVQWFLKEKEVENV